MSRAPAYQHYPKDHAAKELVKLMDLRAEGAYQRLRDHAWLEGSIPASVSDLALLCRVPRAQMARVWPSIEKLFVEVAPGRLVDPDLEEQRKRQDEFRHERSESGRRGNEAKRTLSGGSADAQRTPSVLRTPNSVLPSPETENERQFSPSGKGVTPDQRPAYADAVWREFQRLSGQPATRAITPLEYALIVRWMDHGVPLAIVLRGMADTKKPGRSLSYYGPSVDVAWEQQRKAVA